MSTDVLIVTKDSIECPRDGGTLRTAAIVSALSQAGMTVDWVAVRGTGPRTLLSWRDYLSGAASLGAAFLAFLRTGSPSVLRWFRPRVVATVKKFERNGGRALIIEYSHLAPYAKGTGLPTHLDMHNIESQLYANMSASAGTRARKWAAWYESKRMSWLESKWVPAHTEGISYVSKADEATHAEMSSESATGSRLVAMNGMKLPHAVSAPREEHPTIRLVFIGSLSWGPNEEAACWLSQEVFPLILRRHPDAQLRLVGKGPSDRVSRLASENVQVFGDVPDTSPHLQWSTVSTAPLLAAGGTRLKILEGLAHGRPVVATALGALGLEPLQGKALSIADSAERFADEAVRLSLECGDLVTTAVATVAEYEWSKTLRPLTSHMKNVIEP